MKKNRREQIRKIEQAFVLAHRGTGAPLPDSDFGQGVMRHVRRLGSLSAGPPLNGAASRSVWTFAAAACCLALLFAAWAFSADFSGIQQQVAQMFVGDPLDLMPAEAFALI